jgi:PAS domain S-box-containing protein
MSEGYDADRLAAFFHNSPDAIVVVDEDGAIVEANDRVRDTFGYDPVALEGESVETLLPEVDRLTHSTQRGASVDDPERRSMGVNHDLQARRRDGTTFPVDISLSPIPRDDGSEVMAAIRDISERQQIRRKYRSLVEIAPDAVFVADAGSGEILEVNQRAVDLMKTTEDVLIGRDQVTLHPPDDRERYRQLFQRSVDQKQVTAARFEDDQQLYVETADGDRIPIEISAQVTQLGDRTVIMALFRDISKRQVYEQDLHRQIDRLETLAHVLSHDLRNPLNVAIGGVDAVRETGELDHLDRVADAHDRIEGIIDDVLTMVQDGYEVESVDPVELASLVEGCWTTVATADATLHVETNGLLYVDTRRIRHLFENLFGNAVEHAGDGVRVTVAVTDDGFTVADDGPGVSPADREDVFEPGFTTGEESVGLGMNIVAEIATAHGWAVSIGESDDGGARFEFTGARTAVYDDSFLSGDEE